MALKSTIYKVRVQLSDLDRHYYDEANLTLAQHPSENDARMMLRLLAWMHNASPGLEFNKELCESDQAEIWRTELNGDIGLWIALGLPDEKRLKRACSRAQNVRLYAYGERAAQVWWQSIQQKVDALKNLEVYLIRDADLAGFSSWVSRSMHIQCTIQDGVFWLSTDHDQLELSLQRLQESSL